MRFLFLFRRYFYIDGQPILMIFLNFIELLSLSIFILMIQVKNDGTGNNAIFQAHNFLIV